MKRWSKAEIGQLESKLDVLHEDGGADETRLPLEDNGWSPSDLTGLTTSSLEENQRSVSETDVQPEDGDQELEMSLRSHGGSLVERYHGTVSRIGKAWRRKHVFEAGDAVLRRCGRWRRHAGRSSLSSTFIVPMRHNGRNPEHEASRTPSEESRGQCVGTETTHRPPVRTGNASQQRPRPGKLYHKFVCQSRWSSFSGLPCRFCARSSEAGRAPPPSSSALAALALSPHRSLLRKRHRELDRDAHPLSKPVLPGLQALRQRRG